MLLCTGSNNNIPLKKSTTDDEYLKALKDVMQSDVKNFNPDYLVISLVLGVEFYLKGVDTFNADLVGGFNEKIGKCLNIGINTLVVLEGTSFRIDD